MPEMSGASHDMLSWLGQGGLGGPQGGLAGLLGEGAGPMQHAIPLGMPTPVGMGSPMGRAPGSVNTSMPMMGLPAMPAMPPHMQPAGASTQGLQGLQGLLNGLGQPGMNPLPRQGGSAPGLEDVVWQIGEGGNLVGVPSTQGMSLGSLGGLGGLPGFGGVGGMGDFGGLGGGVSLTMQNGLMQATPQSLPRPGPEAIRPQFTLGQSGTMTEPGQIRACPKPAMDAVVQGRSRGFGLCRNLTQKGSCQFGSNCSFAHSEDERKTWVMEAQGLGASIS